jgi:hypothetical protein
MHAHRILPAILLTLALLPSVQAQPYKYGCHYFRQHPSATPVPTAADRTLIEDIIARSDPLTLLHSAPALDITDYNNQHI